MKFLIISLIFPIVVWSFSNCLDDVKSEFEKLSPHGKRIQIEVEKGVFEPKSYTNRALNRFGFDNHFQGIQKLSGENNFVITGSDLIRNQGDMILIKDGKIFKREVLGVWPFWHPGGIQILGNVLAVPVEEYKKSEIAKIFFYSLEQIEKPQKLPIFIDIPHTKSGAVLFHRLKDKRYLIGSYNMSQIEFYFSRTPDIFDGFESTPRITIDKKSFSLGNQGSFDFGAQSVNAISQCDGEIFMVFFENTGKIIGKDDIARLFSLNLSPVKSPVNLVSSKKFGCGKSCSFAAATGIHIDENGELFIFSSPKYLSLTGKSYNIVEFRKKRESREPSEGN